MNESNLIGMTVRAGAVGISLYLIWLLNRTLQRHKEERQNIYDAVDKMADAQVKIAKSLQRLTDCIGLLNGQKR